MQGMHIYIVVSIETGMLGGRDMHYIAPAVTLDYVATPEEVMLY